MLADIIAIIVVAAIITAVIVYLVKQKKKGSKCVGCPYSKECNNGCNCH